MTIDSHSHVLTEASYEEYQKKNKGRIDRTMAYAFFYQNMEELWQFTSSKENLYLVGSIDMNGNIKKQLARCDKLLSEKKICGIKLYPGYQYFYPSEKKVFPIAELCQKHQKPLIFHSGDFYDMRGYTHKAVLKYSHPSHIDELAAYYPDCPMIISHLGFPRMIESALIISNNPNVYADLSGTIDKQETKEEMEKLMNRYIDDLEKIYEYYPDARKKTLFGTDFIGNDTILDEIDPYLEIVDRVFEGEEKTSVLGGLAKKLFFS